MIKYLGSKRRLVPVLGALAGAAGARTALDLFTGTTRVAQEFKRRGAMVTCVDTARYAEIFGRCWIALDAGEVDGTELCAALDHLEAVPPSAGYFTETFCRQARFFQPHNGERIDAIRDAIEADFADSPLYPVLLTSLILAADRVDSTAGVQMAYVKRWAARAAKPMQLRCPTLLAGPGRAVRTDACGAAELGSFDLAYLDPPYNQHRYYTNYHVWETLVAWDAPEAYGIARKRIDCRDDGTRSAFNSRKTMPAALDETIRSVDAETLIVSMNNEAWVSADALVEMCRDRGRVEVLSFDSKRYVGAQIGIHSPAGEKVGTVSHLRNLEHLVLAGPATIVDAMVHAAHSVTPLGTAPTPR